MRISDWSSDVCSSDLINDAAGRQIESRYHGELRYVHCDVAIDAEVEALVAAAVAHFGRLDIMFNNAGIQGDRAGFTEIEASSFDAMLRLLTEIGRAHV